MAGQEPLDDLLFGLIAESGPLERQALLLCKSLRLFGGKFANARIAVISPRARRRPSAEAIADFHSLGAEYIEMSVDSPAPEYGPSFRVYTAAELEASESASTIAFLDSDIVFTGEPSIDLDGADAAARPVDCKGMCTSGPGDENDAYWRALCDICSVDYDWIPFVESSVDRAFVKASYNGGMVVARRSARVFQRTADYFTRSVKADLRPYRGRNLFIETGHGVVRGIGAEYWGSSQACLSLAIWGDRLSFRTLPPTHNFPIHIDSYVAERGLAEKPVALHYHGVFDGKRSENPALAGKINLSDDFVAWLQRELDAG